MSKKYAKTIRIGHLHNEEISFLEGIIFRLGYERADYKILEYSGGSEMKILNKCLHRDLRTVRKTKYAKAKV